MVLVLIIKLDWNLERLRKKNKDEVMLPGAKLKIHLPFQCTLTGYDY